MKSVLVVEDDRETAILISSALSAPKYSVTIAESGREGLDEYEHIHPDIVILDLNLPEINGFEICKRITKSDEYTPIFMVSGRREEIDRVVALRLGVDDYITKPFYGSELRARVDRFFERWESIMGHPAHESFAEEDRIVRGVMTIDIPGRRIIIHGTYIHFPQKEFGILRLLAESPGVVFSRRVILESIWGTNSEMDERSIDPYIKRIRSKLAEEGGGREWILTVRGSGYSFTSYYERMIERHQDSGDN